MDAATLTPEDWYALGTEFGDLVGQAQTQYYMLASRFGNTTSLTNKFYRVGRHFWQDVACDLDYALCGAFPYECETLPLTASIDSPKIQQVFYGLGNRLSVYPETLRPRPKTLLPDQRMQCSRCLDDIAIFMQKIQPLANGKKMTRLLGLARTALDKV